MEFGTTAVTVLLLVAMAIPGSILVKAKVIKPHAISYFSAVLLYASQPFLSIRSFLQADYTPELAVNLGIVFLFSLLAQGLLFGVLWAILARRFDDPADSRRLLEEGFLAPHAAIKDEGLAAMASRCAKGRACRVFVLAATFGNVGFFGVPVLQMLFPLAPETIAYSAVFIVSMNLMCWTLGSYLLTGGKKYISLKKAILNPQMIALIIALPLFFTGVTSDDLPDAVNKVISFLADMTAPLCMIILGMRFAVAPVRELFTDIKVYISVFIKVLVFPLAVYLVLLPFKSMDEMMKISLVILSGMPSASINLNLAELYGADQKTAANNILLSTLLSILTIPLLMLLF